jgi:hypothetical protein
MLVERWEETIAIWRDEMRRADSAMAMKKARDFGEQRWRH